MKIDDGDMTLLLLSSSPVFEHFKDVILYSKQITTTLDKIQTTVKSKKLSKMKDLKIVVKA